MARSRDLRASLHQAEHGGGLTMIPVLPDDRMVYVFNRLDEANGHGLVAMVEDGHWHVALVWPATSARVTVACEDDAIAQVHCDSEVSMFFDYLHEHGTLVVRQVKQVVARLMPDADLQAV